ncbi:MAG: GDSL-like Lipase/Acylhydrolase [Phycisphaerales bacterium]|nr:GDSL-like Lipase/Acylhydrolase [Phycisphaerales bacterium]
MKNLICLLVLLLLNSAALAQVTPEPGGEKKKGDPGFAKITDDPKLPRVLLIGDSISIGYTPAVRELLKGKANVHRIPANGGPTSNGVKNVEAWIGKEKWDVIHFNFGLHDLKVMPDGKHQVEREQYEKNLEALVDRFEKTGAKVIWATTTPVPEGTLNPPRHFGDVAEYNAVAAKVMSSKKVATDDLNAAVMPSIKTLQKPHDVHYSAEGYKVLAAEVAKSIEAALK